MLPLSPETLAAAYDYIRTTPPFRRWNLPEPEDVRFVVVPNTKCFGWCKCDKGVRPIIAISSKMVEKTQELMETMAHEMIHLHEHHNGVRGWGEHGKAFQAYAARVCKIHGFDPKTF